MKNIWEYQRLFLDMAKHLDCEIMRSITLPSLPEAGTADMTVFLNKAEEHINQYPNSEFGPEILFDKSAREHAGPVSSHLGRWLIVFLSLLLILLSAYLGLTLKSSDKIFFQMNQDINQTFPLFLHPDKP